MVVTVTIVSTLLLMVDAYNRITASKVLDRTLLYLVIPLLVILLVFWDNPVEYGFTFGDWRPASC